MKKILILGHTGKMGTALSEVFSDGYDVVGKNSADFDAEDFEQVKDILRDEQPDIVMNAVVFGGIDACDRDPARALRINTLFPRLLARLSKEQEFILVHFSTDSVFSDTCDDALTEHDAAQPLNMYGLTKYGADCFVQSDAGAYYIARVSVLFGECVRAGQFVEKMLHKMRAGQKNLRIAGDIIASPTYALDAARALRAMIESSRPYGLYHLVNDGKASLCELMQEIAAQLNLDAAIEKASYRDFPSAARKNVCTPMRSVKLPPLRPWREAVREYCGRLK